MNKLLSIIIPTIGNYDLLKITLDSLLPQINSRDDIELIVSLNGPKDNSSDLLKEYSAKNKNIGYKLFDDRVDIIPSFVRSMELACGEYCIIYGDDDFALPGFILTVLKLIEEYPSASIIHYNVLAGKDNGDSMYRKSYIEDNCISCKEKILDLKDFLYAHALSAGFISSLVFKREVWNEGLKSNFKTNKGYGQIMIIYNGAKGKSCLYYDIPLVIKRIPYKRSWLSNWPYYWLIDIPGLMKNLDEGNIAPGIFKHWKKNENKSLLKYLYTLLNATCDRTRYKSLCQEINKFQCSYLRKVLTYFVIYIVPNIVFKILRKLLYK